MQKALKLAKKGLGLTSPNPCVGASIVKGGHIVAEGWHKKAGAEHAEIVAINSLMKKSGLITTDLDSSLFHNATLYVTLEPCCHSGKTGPCVEAIVRAGFRKVCVGMKDPSKKVNGKGIKFLRKNGIAVELLKAGTNLAMEIRDLNKPFIKMETVGLPYLVMKAGISLDGKIATACGDSQWITGEKARKDAYIERSKCDAVLVGTNTVKADDPELAAHGKYKKKNILRVVVDRKLRLSLGSKIFRDKNVFVACTDLASKKARDSFEKAGVEFKSFGEDEVSIKRLMRYLAKRGVQSVFVEGGGITHGSIFDASLKDKDLLDEVLFYVAPMVIGGANSLPVIGGEGACKLSKALKFQEMELDIVGDDLKAKGCLNLY